MAKTVKNGKLNIPMVAAAVLLCLTLISIAMMSGFYAKYISTGEGSDEARVAKFEVTQTATCFSEDMEIKASPGEVSQREIKVENKSEVAIRYIIRIENVTGNIPLEFTVDGAEATADGAFVGAMEPNSNETYTMKINWNKTNAQLYIGMVDLVRVTLTAEQID